MDDILVYSDSLETHISHVRAVLQRLISHQLYAKQRNVSFTRLLPRSWDMLVSPEGVAMDDHKVQAVLNWPKPTL